MAGIIAYLFSFPKPCRPFPAVAVALVLLALPALAACADVSPAIGKYYMGRTLHVSVRAMERTPELRYSLVISDDETDEMLHYRLAPEQAGNELVMLRVRVENHTATSAIVSIDRSAAELRDFFNEKYFPIDIRERPEAVSAPADSSRERLAKCPLEQPGDDNLCFLWNTTMTDGSVQAFDLQKGYGVEGWLLFEVPQDTIIREMRWRAGDGLTIDFKAADPEEAPWWQFWKSS